MSESGVSILWSVVPAELVLEGLTPPLSPRMEVAVAGRLLEVEPQGDGTARLVRLISAVPADYLDPRLQPGVQLRLP